MKTLFLIASFNAVFFALLLYNKKPGLLHDKVLFWWLLYLSLYTSVYGFTHEFIFYDYPLLSTSLISLFLLHGPFLYLYIKPLSTGIKKFKRGEWWHFIPFAAFNTYILISGIIPDLSEGISLSHVHHEGNAPLLLNIFLLVTVLSGPVYFVLSYRLLHLAENKLLANYSFSKEVDPDWLRKLVIIFGVIWTFLIIVTAIHHVFNYFSLFFCTNGLSLALSVFIILTGYFGLRQKAIFISSEIVNEEIKSERVKYAGSGLDKEDVKELSQILADFMMESKPYLNPELTLATLASQLYIPPHHLSRVVNESFDANFFDFINRHRIEEVKKRIGSDQYNHLSILGIALDCGFNSKSAFNRLFKQYTGKTPTAYKAGVLNGHDNIHA